MTGATSGIGKEAAYFYASKGARLIITARNLDKAESMRREFLKDFRDLNMKIYQLDVSSFNSIDAFTDLFIENKEDVDIFINNAGVYHLPKTLSVDGFELVMATNFLGVKRLNDRLLPYLKSLSHPINVLFTTSVSAHIAKIDYEDFFMDKKYKKTKQYANSKLSIIHYFLSYLDKTEGTNIVASLSHPGTCFTPLFYAAYPKALVTLIKPLMKVIFHKPDKAALTILYAIDHDVAGSYVAPKGFVHMAGYPKLFKLPKKFHKNRDKTIELADGIIKENKK